MMSGTEAELRADLRREARDIPTRRLLNLVDYWRELVHFPGPQPGHHAEWRQRCWRQIGLLLAELACRGVRY